MQSHGKVRWNVFPTLPQLLPYQLHIRISASPSLSCPYSVCSDGPDTHTHTHTYHFDTKHTSPLLLFFPSIFIRNTLLFSQIFSPHRSCLNPGPLPVLGECLGPAFVPQHCTGPQYCAPCPGLSTVRLDDNACMGYLRASSLGATRGTYSM